MESALSVGPNRAYLRLSGSLYIPEKLPTYPSPKPTLTLTPHLGQNVCLGDGKVGGFPDTYHDPTFLTVTKKHRVLPWPRDNFVELGKMLT